MKPLNSILMKTLAMALLGSLAVANAVQAQQELRLRSAGSSTGLGPPDPETGIVSLVARQEGTGGFGKFVADAFGVVQIGAGNPADCEANERPDLILNQQVVLTYNDGSQSLSEGSGFQCAGGPAGFRTSVSGGIFGGTKRFEGRTGTFQTTCTGLLVDLITGPLARLACATTLTLD